MAYSETGKAIGCVTNQISTKLNSALKIDVHIGRPEPPQQNGYKKQLNLFLYEAIFDPSLKNLCLHEGEPEPLWLVLRYLLTAYDNEGSSESVEAYEYLGEAVRALSQLNFLDGMSEAALQDNPEPLKITFNEASVELLSKLMQGGDEKYRFSMAFEVRPVMIMSTLPPKSSLLVGIDYLQALPEIRSEREKGVHVATLPMKLPEISKISAAKFEPNETATVFGTNLNLADLTARLGTVPLPVISQRPDKLTLTIDGSVKKGRSISAGSHLLQIVQSLPSGRRRSSNPWLVGLLPLVIEAKGVGIALASEHPENNFVVGRITIKGYLLGSDRDEIRLSFYQAGRVLYSFEIAGPSLPADPLADAQTALELKIVEESQVANPLDLKKVSGIKKGVYMMILTVNGQQARNSPEVALLP